MKLYRFEKLERGRFETLGKKQLWLSRTDRFRDPKDCFIAGLSIPPMTPTEFQFFEKLIESYYHEKFDYSESVLPESVIVQLKEFVRRVGLKYSLDSDFTATLKSFLRLSSEKNKIAETIRKSVGVCCFFSGEINDEGMWAEYADMHKGYCIEYEYTFQNDSAIRPVSYVSQTHWNSDPKGIVVSARELALCPEETLTRLVTTKGIDFTGEQEYRFVEPRAFFHGAEEGKRVELPEYLKPIRAITGNEFSENGRALQDEFNATITGLDLEVQSYNEL